MLKIPRLASQAFSCGSLHSLFYPTGFQVVLRSISTNTAIHRGIRKSFRAGGRDRLRSRDDASTPRPSFEEREPFGARPRRPQHQQGQDAEDTMQSWRATGGTLSTRQQEQPHGREDSTELYGGAASSRHPDRDFQEGGRRGNPARSTDRYGSGRSPYGNAVRTGAGRQERLRPLAGQYGATGSSIHAKKPSGVLNRAARRASIYGHLENPPTGYRFPRTGGSDGERAFERPSRFRALSSPQRSSHSEDHQPKARYRSLDHRESRDDGRYQVDPLTIDGQGNSSYNTRDSTSRDYVPRSSERAERSYYREREPRESFSSGPPRSSGREQSYTAAHGLSTNPELPPVDPEKDRRRSEWKVRAPLSIPYTTSASEFLYGTSVITAALKSDRRKLYNLYLYNGENRENVAQDVAIRKLALSRGVEVSKVQGDWLRLMDKMSAGRPHNGYILEASPLPKLPVVGFKPVQKPSAPFHVLLDHQSREEAAINGTSPSINYSHSFPRFPFVLLLDGILDPGNLGAIMRTAHFLGIDAVAVSNRNSAPFTPVTLKASAGASECLPLVSIAQPAAFIDECQRNGWKFYAAVAPGGTSTWSANAPSARAPYCSTATLGAPTREHPCVLILGGEGEGLRWTIQKKADFVVGIEGQRAGEGGVDSLNVSVAAGLLCEAFMRRPERSAHSSLGRQSETPTNFKIEANDRPSDGETPAHNAPEDNGISDTNRLF